ncbi:unnamed protein product, partial [Vitis vinifera]
MEVITSEAKTASYDTTLLRRIVKITVFTAAFVVVPCFFFYNSAFSFQFLPISAKGKEGYKLDKILKNAAMGDKTVILTTVNEAWAANNSLLDLFLESFRIGNNTQRLLNHLVIITLDPKAYARCTTLHPHCYALKTKEMDFSKEAFFMSHDYLEMMWRRIDFLRSVLKMRYNFIFTDADIMWFRDPFQRFDSKADFQIACDYFNGNSSDVNNSPNGGFTYHDPFITKIGLKMRFLDTAYFGGFCQRSKDLNLVCTMHANCCVGLGNKIHDLGIMLHDWRKFTSFTPNTNSTSSSWTVPQNCSLKSFHDFCHACRVFPTCMRCMHAWLHETLHLPPSQESIYPSPHQIHSSSPPLLLHAPHIIFRTNTRFILLREILEKAAMGDKTVILTTVNGAWAANNSLLDLFLESFHIGNNTKRLLNHLVIIALDQKSYARCLALHPLCYALKTEGVDFSGEAYYSTPNYLEMMWRRIDFLRSILTMGYSFIFTDADIMWFRDPFQHFFQDADFQITCDSYIGNPYDVNNRPNGGFTYMCLIGSNMILTFPKLD